MANGLFAPGHLGELTRIVPFEMVDADFTETGAVQQRLRKIPARVVVYLLLAAALFEECGYLAVWHKRAGGDTGREGHRNGALGRPESSGCPPHAGSVRPVPRPGHSGLYRQRPLPGPADRRDRRHLSRCPCQPAAPGRLGKGSNQYAASGYPQICLTALVACGTRAVLDAAFGPRASGETVYGKRLTHSLHAGMIILLDRGFSSNAFVAAVAATEAAFLTRVSAARKPLVLARFDDGSYLSRFGAVEVRVIEREITITTSQGPRTGLYRLATNLLDHHRYPASSLVSLYHERWEVESAYFAIKKSMLSRRVLRSQTWAGITLGGLRPAERLPDPADRDHRRYRDHTRSGPRPRQFQYRAPMRSRSDHPGRGHHRRPHDPTLSESSAEQS
ncbi:transposase domain-containing protein [Streptomyces oceani]|uniref:transposase domain-containing protein n=1 Tax=Streptomyces oceani TaxID=1075402 RepID=UPI000AFB4B7A|nr:transposase domain-containing protein [Streptomyces oceani]